MRGALMQNKAISFYKRYSGQYSEQELFDPNSMPLTRFGLIRKYLSFVVFYASYPYVSKLVDATAQDSLFINSIYLGGYLVLAAVLWPRRLNILGFLTRYLCTWVVVVLYWMLIIYLVSPDKLRLLVAAYPWLTKAAYLPFALYAFLMIWLAPPSEKRTSIRSQLRAIGLR
ncbi:MULTISPECIES: hypothetical protein [Pseudovibrio]|uniref:Uncharacterized protein n=1 Tax=Pseudovibrio ascidiaceicola TaxID=285279 RepID=A0A1I3VPT3_9HYPH|nr:MULTISPECIES: hypothetical protein [Pseudovibrio]KZL16485.1 hypothetical protein PsAD26_00525 [Pseudovibrio sp. Ad26]SFJ97414.1 hypothetical protein SAMN04488518_101550 [Pseudovibrio ascidiaceicola]